MSTARPSSAHATPATPPHPLRVGAWTAPILLGLLALPSASAQPTLQGETTRVSLRAPGMQGTGDSQGVQISTNGRYVTFTSGVDDLVPGDTNGLNDVFWADRITGVVRRVNVGDAGQQANGNSASSALSGDGQVVAFMSLANNLVPGDTNGFQDIFVHDLSSGSLARVNVDSSGIQGNASYSGRPALSSDGRFVVFESEASNLVPGDGNGVADVFRHDRATGTTIRVSVDSGGNGANGASMQPSISGDGRYVAFVSMATNLVPGDTNARDDVFVHDALSGVTVRASVATGGGQADGRSSWPSLSADGRYVAFESLATNLVAGDTNARADVFVHDRVTGITERVSIASTGTQGNNNSQVPQISADGRHVVFQSIATDLVAGDTNGAMDVFRHDRLLGETVRVSLSSTGAQGNGPSRNARASGDGRYVAFESNASTLALGDAGPYFDVFVRDMQTSQTSLVSVCGFWTQANDASQGPSLSADGRYVAFQSTATDLVANDTNGESDIFLHDRLTGTTQRVSLSNAGAQANGRSSEARISREGRFVAFSSLATDLVPGDVNGWSDVFLRDRRLGTTECVSLGFGGVPANGNSYLRGMTGDGRYLAFISAATNLVAGGTSPNFHVYLRDRQAGTTELVSQSSGGIPGNGQSNWGSISEDGRYVAFQSGATDLVQGDTNGVTDVFVRDRLLGSTQRISMGFVGGQANAASFHPSQSADGRYVCFESDAFNLVQGDANGFRDIFLWDRNTSSITLVSVSHAGQGSNGFSEFARISGDGRSLTFKSYATNLVVGDLTLTTDLYLRDLTAGVTHLLSVSTSGVQGNGDSEWGAISADGRQVAFTSAATNLVPDDDNGVGDVFLHDRAPLDPVPYCYGDGSGTPCPCGNDGAFGRGCANGSFAGGGRLLATGLASLTGDTLVLSVGASTPSNPGLFFQGTQAVAGYAGLAFGDGLRCAGGMTRRLQVRSADGAGNAASTVSLSIAGAVSAGDTRFYQWWYRDPALSPCGAGFNTTNGLRVLWQP